MCLALPFIFLRLLLRSIRVPSYRQRWPERLGIFSGSKLAKNGIWIHAVSVGEVVAAIPLIKSLQAKYPTMLLTVTTTTPTGSQRLKQSLQETVNHVFMPYDIPWAINSFIKKIQPSCLIIMETELWPNLLHVCKSVNIPVIIANGRISDKSLSGYHKIKGFVAQMLQQVTFVAAQSKLDAERFLLLGLTANKMQISGNLKFDVQVPELQQQLGKSLKANLGARQVLVAASTHAGEEEQIIAAFKYIKHKFPDCLLILVPRHPDRFNSVAKLLDENQLSYRRRTQNATVDLDTQVLLGDTMGELNIFYAAADLAFVGGSLIPIGGHNLLEPVALGVTTITGPFISNFQEITDKLRHAGAIRIVQDSNQLAELALVLLAQDSLRHEISLSGLAMIEQNRGAVLKVLNILSSYLSQESLQSELALRQAQLS